jgi:magnesium transporter
MSELVPVECAATVVAFDFESKKEETIAFAQVAAAMEAGRFVWIDLDAQSAQEAARLLACLPLLQEDVIDAALREEVSTQYARYDDYLHLVVSGYRRRGDALDLERVSVILGERFLVTLHRGPVEFLAAVRRHYHADFVRFARTPSFLVYELWDHLVENYLAMQKVLGDRVEVMQRELSAGNVTEQVFKQISDLGSDLLHFRKVLLPARAALSDLASRRSLFLSDATQTFLGNMVGSVDHVLQELLVDREILSESLNLYMSMVSHRTNEVMKKLTVVSVVFLPLTFLVGVYGMNFELIPELHWRHGYAYFWVVVVVTVAAIVRVVRRARLL